jgi:anthranilate synthase component 1
LQTCIALRTMLVKDGIAYLQAGVGLTGFPALAASLAELTIGQGGIVFDSDPYDEWMETINKLGELLFSFCHVPRLGA